MKVQEFGGEDLCNETSKIDIDEIVDSCFLEQELSTVEILPEEGFILLSEESFAIIPNPDFDFTLEEELKIYEMVAIKENLLDHFFDTLRSSLPQFLNRINHFFTNEKTLLSTEQILRIQMRFKGIVDQNIDTNNKVSNLLNCFSAFKHVPEDIKLETIKDSLKTAGLCFR